MLDDVDERDGVEGLAGEAPAGLMQIDRAITNELWTPLQADARVRCPQTLDDSGRVVLAAVVGENQLEMVRDGIQRLGDRPVQLDQMLALVEHGGDN